MTSPFDFIRSFNDKSDVEFSSSDYKPYVINRALSFNKDTIHFASMMNKFSMLEKVAQFDFYMKGIPKGKRYGKWLKPDETTEVVELLMKQYCINNRTATEYAALLSERDIQQLRETNEKGGKHGTRN